MGNPISFFPRTFPLAFLSLPGPHRGLRQKACRWIRPGRTFEEKTMTNFRRIILLSSVLLLAWTAAACGAVSPAPTPTLTPVPSMTATSSPQGTPLPTTEPTLEMELRPSLPPPAMEGDVDVNGK